MSYSRNEGISTHELHPLVSNATNINFAHTLDNNRRSALAEIDNAKFSWAVPLSSSWAVMTNWPALACSTSK